MEDKKEEVRYDLDGQEVVTTALMDLINQYPGLSPGDSIEYATLGDSKGKQCSRQPGVQSDRKIRM